MVSLFAVSNHMLLVYSLVYACLDLLRAFVYGSDTSFGAEGIAVVFFCLSIWLLIDSVLYYKAFLQEMEALRTGGLRRSAVEGTGVSTVEIFHVDVQAATSDAPTAPSMPKEDTVAQVVRRWSFYLRTEAGFAYFLNIVGSFGYILSTLVSLFLDAATSASSREIDRASLFIDLANMIIFSIDGVLFWRVWYAEAEQPTLKRRCTSVHMWANLCNTASSVAYACFIIWALHARYDLASRDEQQNDPDYFDDQLVHIIQKQRTMMFVADCVYLLYAILLEISWYREVRGEDESIGSVQLKEIDA